MSMLRYKVFDNGCTILDVFLRNWTHYVELSTQPCPELYYLLKTKKNTTHRGELLQAAIQQSDLSIKQITDRAGYSRSSYYNHKVDPNLSFDILMRYGKVLKYDFAADIPGMQKYHYNDDVIPRPQPKTFQEAIEDRDYWRDKYVALLEKYNAVIERAGNDL